MLTDLELLNQVIADHARQLAIGNGPSAIQSPEIKDPAIRFFAEQLAPSHPSHPSQDSHQTEPHIDI